MATEFWVNCSFKPCKGILSLAFIQRYTGNLHPQNKQANACDLYVNVSERSEGLRISLWSKHQSKTKSAFASRWLKVELKIDMFFTAAYRELLTLSKIEKLPVTLEQNVFLFSWSFSGTSLLKTLKEVKKLQKNLVSGPDVLLLFCTTIDGHVQSTGPVCFLVQRFGDFLWGFTPRFST